MELGHNAAADRLVDSYGKFQQEILAPGPLKRVGNYQIVRRLAAGSFSTVYLAFHVLTRLEVVLKSAPKTQVGLASEIANLSELRHPHIIRLWEIVVLPDAVWLALEYCPGDELYARIQSGGAIPEPAALRVFSQICGAVAYAHARHIAHRDLKLENVMLDEHGTTAKLADFGFTRNYGAAKMLETICGTAPYMAPELFKRQKYDPEATDAWALGVVLYALLYGKLPFDEEDEEETKQKITEGEPTYPAGPTQPTLTLLKELLQKDPKSRPRPAQVLSSVPLRDSGGPAQLEILDSPTPSDPAARKRAKRTLKAMSALNMDLSELTLSLQNSACDPLYGLWHTALERGRQIEELSASSQPRFRSDNRSLSSVRRVARAIARTPEQLGRGSIMLVQNATTPRKSSDTSRSFFAIPNSNSGSVNPSRIGSPDPLEVPTLMLRQTFSGNEAKRSITGESTRSKSSLLIDMSGPLQRLAKRLNLRRRSRRYDSDFTGHERYLSTPSPSSKSASTIREPRKPTIKKRQSPLAEKLVESKETTVVTVVEAEPPVNDTAVAASTPNRRHQSLSPGALDEEEAPKSDHQHLDLQPTATDDTNSAFGSDLGPDNSTRPQELEQRSILLGSNGERLSGTSSYGLGSPRSRSILIPRSMSQMSTVSQMSQTSGLSDHSRDSFSFTAFIGRISGTASGSGIDERDNETKPMPPTNDEGADDEGESLWNWLPGHAARKDFKFQRKRMENSSIVADVVEELEEPPERGVERAVD